MNLQDLPKASSPKAYLLLLCILFGLTFILTIQQSPVLYVGAVAFSTLLIYLCLSNFRINFYHLVILLLFLSIIAPPLRLSGGIPDIRFEEFIFYGFFPFILILSNQTWDFKGYSTYFVWAYIAFMGSMFISTLYGGLFLSVPITLGDTFNFVTVGKYLLAFFVIYHFSFSEKQLHRLLYIILLFLILSGFLGVLQYYGVMGLNTVLGPLYNPTRTYMVTERLIGTFHNPNTYSFILTIGITIASCLLYFERVPGRKVFLSLTLAFFIFLVLITGSRTGVGSMIIILTCITLYNSYKQGYNVFKILGIFTLVTAAILGLITLVSAELLIRYISGINITTDASLMMRLIVWYLNFELFLDSPILGWGPAEAIHASIVDSEYLLTARRYGIIGLFLNLLFYFIPVRAAFKKYKPGTSIYDVWSQVVIFSTILFLIGNVTNPIFHEIQAMDFWIILIAIFFSAKSREESMYKKQNKS